MRNQTDQYLRGSFKQLKLQKLDFNTSPRLGSTEKEQPLNDISVPKRDVTHQ